jgi:glycosyltransferase involved in cell wall biosynthesis
LGDHLIDAVASSKTVAPSRGRQVPLRIRALGTAPTISVVIPTLNEARNLPHVLPRLPAMVTEVIIVDGDSTDGTIDVALQLRPDARIVRQVGRGKGSALRSGFAEARGDIIVSIDADGSTKPEEIALFVDALLDGADYVKGSRFLRGGGSTDLTAFRSAGNLALTGLVRVLHGARFTDLCYGYNAFWADVLPSLGLVSTGFEIETEMNLRAHHARLRIVEVPSQEVDRIYGASNLRPLHDGMRVLKMILRERLRRVPGSMAPDPVIHRAEDPSMAAFRVEPSPTSLDVGFDLTPSESFAEAG